jgi:hypothetical protein
VQILAALEDMVQVHERVDDGLREVVSFDFGRGRGHEILVELFAAVVFFLPDPAFGMLEDAKFSTAFSVAEPFAETLEVAGLWLF